MTPQRRAIVTEIMRASGHISPGGIAGRVRERVPGVNPSTVYRTLGLLEEIGVVSHSHLEAGAEYHRSDRSDHVHLVCAGCARAESLPAAELEPLRRLIEGRTGFAPDFTHFAVSGLCATCRAKG
jgi:Fur family ferric uptake transcriptional regulator